MNQGFPLERSIELVRRNAMCGHERAREALVKYDGDLVEVFCEVGVFTGSKERTKFLIPSQPEGL
jgi:hypothetical protein